MLQHVKDLFSSKPKQVDEGTLRLSAKQKVEQIGSSVTESISEAGKQAKKFVRSKSMMKLVSLSMMGAMMIAVCTSLTVANRFLSIYEGDEVYYRYTPYTELEDILSEQQITLGANDDYAFSGFDEENRATLVIKRAFEVRVTADGETKSVVMTDGTVSEALAKADVSYGEDDLINAAMSEKVNPGSNIVINRVTFEETVDYEEVAFETIRPDYSCPETHHEERSQTGKNGERTIVKKTRYVDGESVETVVVSDEITTEPVNEVYKYVENISPGVSTLRYKTGELELDDNGNPVNYKYKVTGKATAYSALGKPTKLVPGCVAMDLSKFPRGTKLYVKTPDGGYVYGYSKVADTGGFVSNGSGVLIDLFFNTYQESVKFGAKTVDVYVLD